MKILIATGVFPPDIGGPAQYAKNLFDEFDKEGHETVVARYGIEHDLPIGIRQAVFFIKTFWHLFSAHYAIAMDTFSVGIPTIIAARILGKKVVVRIAGDFLWESYVERTGHLITLRRFYEELPKLSLKEKIVFWLSKKILIRAHKLVFSTEWQRDIWITAYGLHEKQTTIIENFFRKEEGMPHTKKNFIWAVRPLRLKNGRMLYRAFAEAKKADPELVLDDGRYPYEEMLHRIRSCYAVILPSISDVSPNLILDAISYNKPFIVTVESGYTEKFKNIGLFIDPFNEKDITKKILTLADGAEYEKYKGKVARYVFSHSYTKIASEYLKLYSKL